MDVSIQFQIMVGNSAQLKDDGEKTEESRGPLPVRNE